MAPVTHLLLSWTVSVAAFKSRRNRMLVSLSGIAPDLDGLGIVVDAITGKTAWYSQYHHVLGHNLLAAFTISLLCAWIAKTNKACVWFASFFCFHLHIFCDVLGSKGPDGFQWPIQYAYPMMTDYNLVWSGQWALNAWQNQILTALLIVLSCYIGITKRICCLEVFSTRMNITVFNVYDKYIRR
ncbi:hypothetical protein N473_16795 [Pseudoalteromonas luteoviolacea CPMOR-1]|uniref:Metal-dependent hydrolase n=1 Tax=Pseudoalteromonas luteoviolacea CPMOR-1 TaxID=1365248 RepID=A0A162C7J3_9GAMM|nr:metal-dependent hydrolase [Pseudoalteromonas luteoviolacea]KZN63480.1 hypothetical protein N473_16795 [Pseudoalteromonas luteoviolacea CPMOR-1]